MGGAGPYVEYDPDMCSFWKARTGIKLSKDEQQAAYLRSQEFILARVDELVRSHGWMQKPCDGEVDLFLISKEICNIKFPQDSMAFFSGSRHQEWHKMFRLNFAGKRQSSDDFIISSAEPLADIFYLLQILFPGMLVLARIDEIVDVGEHTYTRALPRIQWLEKHEEKLITIVGGKSRFQLIMEAAGDWAKSFKVTSMPYDWGYDDPSDEMGDFTACDKECGYWGRCEY